MRQGAVRSASDGKPRRGTPSSFEADLVGRSWPRPARKVVKTGGVSRRSPCLASAREWMDYLGRWLSAKQGRVQQRGGQDRSGRHRATSMASRMSGRGCIRIDDSGRPSCSDRVPGRFVRPTLRPSHPTSFIVCVPRSETELAATTCSSVLAKPHKSHPVARSLTLYAAARKLSAPTQPESPNHDA
jgi:hypothetical protein